MEQLKHRKADARLKILNPDGTPFAGPYRSTRLPINSSSAAARSTPWR